jgi:hypothetical protein
MWLQVLCSLLSPASFYKRDAWVKKAQGGWRDCSSDKETVPEGGAMNDDLEFSDYGREHGPKVAMVWAGMLMLSVTLDWLIIRGIVHAVRAICR